MAAADRLKLASIEAARRLASFQRSPMYRPTLFALGALLATTTLIVGSSAKESLSQSPEAPPEIFHGGASDAGMQPQVMMAKMNSRSAPASMHAAMPEMASDMAQAEPMVAGMAAPTRAGKMQARASGGHEAWRSAPVVDAVTPPASRLLVKNGNVQLEVPRGHAGGIPAAMKVVQAKAEALNGHVERSNTYSNDEDDHIWRQQVASGRLSPDSKRPDKLVQSGSVTVRVPTKSFEAFMEHMSSLDLAVVSSSHNVQDVTDQYVDTVARVNTQQAALKQLEEIMKQATRVQDMTAVQTRMMNVVETLERHKATQLRLEKQASMSTVHVSLNLQPAAPQPPRPRDVPAWSAGNSIHRAVNTLLATAQWLVDAVITALLVGIPLTAFVVLCLFAGVQALSKALSYFAGDLGGAVSSVRSAAADVAAASSGARSTSPNAGARQRAGGANRID